MTKKKIPIALLLSLAALAIVLIAYPVFKHEGRNTAVIMLSEMAILFCFAASYTDITRQEVSNKLILAMLGTWIICLIPQFFVSEQTVYSLFIRGVVGFLGSGLMVLIVYLLSRKGLGGGDVKFIAALGCYLGFSDVLSSLLFGSCAAAVTALVLIAAKKIKRTDSFPFIPFIYFGVLLTLFLY